MESPKYQFLREAGKIQNARLSSSIVLSGNIHDLFFLEGDGRGEYVPLINLLSKKWNIRDRILIVYELAGPIRFVDDDDRREVENAWTRFRTGLGADDMAIKKMLDPYAEKNEKRPASEFASHLSEAHAKPAYALEFLRQLCMCSRGFAGGEPLLKKDLIIIIERADMLIPEGEISRLSDADRRRISICHNWFSDYGFISGNDVVVMVAESKSFINREVGALPQIVEVEIVSPSKEEREFFIEWFDDGQLPGTELKLWSDKGKLAEFSAGLSIHALRQLLVGACYENKKIMPADVVRKVEEYIKGQLGEDVVEFKKPSHFLKDCVGFSRVKKFTNEELMPRLKASGHDAISGVIVCGPIGSGKTYLFEAVASESEMVVLVLKGIRSQWFGQTDVLFERLKRLVMALHKVGIFLDEADTQPGGVSADVHPTERRLTGKIQAMMSDSALRGKVFWILMTARIHLLSADIRRPGRGGDMIIPILDPEGNDREEFLRWALEAAINKKKISDGDLKALDKITEGYSAASFSLLRSELKIKGKQKKLGMKEVLEITSNILQPAIKKTRRYQELQALMNCTRRNLLPNPDVTEKERDEWRQEAIRLEHEGIR